MRSAVVDRAVWAVFQLGMRQDPGLITDWRRHKRQKAQTSAAESAGTIASANAGREEFNTAVGEEKQLPSVFATANQGGEVAGEVNKEAQVSQQNIDTEKRAASFSGVLGKGLSGAGGAVLGGLSPASAGSKLAAQQMVPMPSQDQSINPR